MNVKDIRQLVTWLSAANLTALHIQRSGFELMIRRGSAKAPLPAPVPVAQVVQVAEPVATVNASGPGHFFSQHPDERKPWVQVGDRVQAGQLLGVLQIGQLMLPVRSDRAGQVSALRAGEGEPVGYGQPLFELAN